MPRPLKPPMPPHAPHHSPMLPAPPMPPRPARSHSFCCTPLPSQPPPRWSRRKQTSFAFGRSPAPRKADVSSPSGLERAHCNSVFETCNIVQRQGFSSIATLSSASGGGLGATRLRPAPVRKLHHWLTSWVNTDALHCFGDAANSQKGTFMVRVQNQPVNPGVLVAIPAARPKARRFFTAGKTKKP